MKINCQFKGSTLLDEQTLPRNMLAGYLNIATRLFMQMGNALVVPLITRMGKQLLKIIAKY